jgi:Platelet-activating factor acetylhydrolase, isoform II
MFLRRRLTAALALATAAACNPSVNKEPLPTPPGASSPAVDYAVFDPTASPPAIPLPNDLALQPSAIATQTGAQAELLQAFAAAGGFPNDQETPITIDFIRESVDASNGKITRAAPDLDLSTFTTGGATTFVVIEAKPTGAVGPAHVDTLNASDYVKASDHGTLTVHNQASPTNGSRRWNAGSQYIVAIRGGASGVKIVAGGTVNPQPVTYLITRGKDLTLPENQGLVPGNTPAEKIANATQLEFLRRSYSSAFAAVSAFFPVDEIVLIQTFKIAPSTGATQVETDASAGLIPLPSDLLLDPANGGKTIVNNPAFGPLAAGIATLDGFSTTAMILSQTSAPIVASTVNNSTVLLYELSASGPTRVFDVVDQLTPPGTNKATYVSEPFLITQKPGASGLVPCTATDPASGCFSTAIGLQPAEPVPTPAGTINLPPLKEATEYAVVVSSGVKDTTGAGLARSTLAKILLFQNPLADLAAGKSLLGGVDDGQAVGLEKMRLALVPVLAKAQSDKGVARDAVSIAYTFRTQSITGTALKLAAAPYQTPAAFVPGTPVNVTALFVGKVPLTNVNEILSVPIPTLNPIDVQTGALNPNTAAWTPSSLNALVVVPVTTGTPAAPVSAPLVVFQHGLGRSKQDVGAIASALATAGFVVAAIDAPLHGDRAYCTGNTDCACPTGVTCTPACGFFGPAGLQGDTTQIGQCTPPSVAIPAVSGKFFVTANFFRTRDALRQDVLDNSALILGLAPLSVPSNPLAAELLAKGVTINPAKVFWIGQSLGGILGTLNTAANPRISRAVLNVPGGTLVDVFTQSPSFATQVAALLGSLTPPITPGTPQFLQFIQVAKLVVDGAEPMNFGGHLIDGTATLPDLLQSKPNQTAKNVFGQYAICDQVIPNAFNLLLFSQIGLTSGTNPNPFTSYTVTGAGTPPACVSPNLATDPAHGFLLNGSSATAAGQSDAAQYLLGILAPVAAR